ncbi:MerR family DNA-binding protein [Streptomyces sp900116325]|uniref:MerR family DNA-binding protein n=1 Tax=Streptomyces sp. 900116325 TaxID=3154295 RepID=A0ABV2UFD6_9ACTN
MPEPPRTSGGYRDYPAAAESRLAFIRDAQHAGLTFAEIRGVLGLRDSGKAPCGHVTDLINQHLDETTGAWLNSERPEPRFGTLPDKPPGPTRSPAATPTTSAASSAHPDRGKYEPRRSGTSLRRRPAQRSTGSPLLIRAGPHPGIVLSNRQALWMRNPKSMCLLRFRHGDGGGAGSEGSTAFLQGV